jgi:eukaryotic-like serine/threonine-protein kinase
MPGREPQANREFVDGVIESWRSDGQPDARRVLHQHPEIASDRSLALDLVYEEYCLRREAGEQIDTDEFCQKFPTLRHSLARMMDVHRVLASQSLGISESKTCVWPSTGGKWLDWELVEEIGRGAFSRVFLAREPALGNRQVVVKCSRSGPQEAYLLGQLNHPNIAVVHSIQVDAPSGLTGICMSYVGRVTLSNILDKLWESGSYPQPLSVCGKADQLLASASLSSVRVQPEPFVSRIAVISERLADALSYAEEQGVVHGDLKPSNILLTAAGEPVLVDFNLSRQPNDAIRRFGGTPPYMAPEVMDAFFNQVSSGELTPSFRGDQYSFGVVIHELLCGLPPHDVDFEDGRPVYVPAGSKALEEGDDDGFLSIVRRCLSPKPEDRFESFSELKKHVAGWLETRRKRANSRRLTRRIAIGVAAAALLTTGAAGYKVATRQSFNERRLRSAIQNITDGDFTSASTRLGQLYSVEQSPILAAWAGYCFAKDESYGHAVVWFDLVLADDDRDAHVWNNRGYCNSQIGKIDRAEADFSKAISLDPTLKVAYHNRAMLRLRKAIQSGTSPGEEVFEDIAVALQDEEETAQLHATAAMIHGYAKARGRPDGGAIERHLLRAIELGEKRSELEKSKSIFQSVDIKEIAQRARVESTPRIKAELLLKPSASLASEISRFKD